MPISELNNVALIAENADDRRAARNMPAGELGVIEALDISKAITNHMANWSRAQ